VLRTPDYWPQATRELAVRDAVLRGLIDRFRGLTLGSRGDAFSTLARSIVGQQISVKAAQSVWDRLSGRLVDVTPASVCNVRTSTLKACGLSGQKALYLRELSRKFRDGTLDAAHWDTLDDEGLIVELTSVKGIGRWTAEMFLIFSLGRMNVLPVGDLGLQAAVQNIYRLKERPGVKELRALGEKWHPLETVGTWYAWRQQDETLIAY